MPSEKVKAQQKGPWEAGRDFGGAAALPHFLPRILFLALRTRPESAATLQMLWQVRGSSPEWTRTGEEGVKIMIELNHQYALDGRDASLYRGSFGVPGALRAALFGPIRQMRSDNTPRRVSARYGIRPGSLGAGHTEVPKEEAYKFYHHVEPCLSNVLRKGAARPRIGANREFTMPLVPGKSEAFAAEPCARLSRRIGDRTCNGQISGNCKCKRRMDIGRGSGICGLRGWMCGSARRHCGPGGKDTGRSGRISTFPLVTVLQYY